MAVLTAQKKELNLKEIQDAPPSQRIEILYNQVAQKLGWAPPKGLVKFRRGTGIGKDARFLESSHTDTSYAQADEGSTTVKKYSPGTRDRYFVRRINPRPPVIPPTFQFLVNRVAISFHYGDPGDSVYNPATMQDELKFQPKPIYPTVDDKFGDGSFIEVDPSRDPLLFYYLMLCPWCCYSPVHLTMIDKERYGIDIQGNAMTKKASVKIVPDIADLRKDRQDEIGAADAALIGQIAGMGLVELENICLKARISLRANAESPRNEMIAALTRVVVNRAQKGFKEKYEIVSTAILGAARDYIGTIQNAMKAGILSHDGDMWSHGHTKLSWSVMTDQTSHHVAVPGEEVRWLAEKIAMDNLETWYMNIEEETNVAMQEKEDKVLEDAGPEGMFLVALRDGLITYDPKNKVMKWADDKSIICDTKSWRPHLQRKVLMIHFADKSLEEIAAMIAEHTRK